MKVKPSRLVQAQVVDESLLRDIEGILGKYAGKRPNPERNLDHVRATEETLALRGALLQRTLVGARRKLLFLGDNDLTSIAHAIATGGGEATTIVDIDRRILDFIDDVASAEGFNISVLEHDLRNPLPKDAMPEQDVVFFDPPYTPKAINVWLRRAIELTLKSGRKKARKSPDRLANKEYFLCYGYTDRSTERGLAVQEVITALRLIVTEKIRGFNRYHGAASIGSTSDLYLLQPTPRVDLRSIEIARGQFYTGQKKGGRKG